jgi:RNA polymerase sigma-70 factor (ECF subfamily)
MHQAVNNAEDRVRTTELSGRNQTVLENLPPQCRLIFVKSRMENKRYATIAMEMGISVKTVEAQMGKALKIFRDKLKNYL